MYMPENHYCALCDEYLGPDDGDADCGAHDDEEWETANSKYGDEEAARPAPAGSEESEANQ